MNRRNILFSALGLAATTGLAPASAAPTRRPFRPAPLPPRPNRNMIVARDGTRLFHREFGDGPTTLLFSASWALDSRMWDYQVAHFATSGFRCIAWDRRGHGRSDLAPTGYDMDTFADDLGEVIGQLDVRDAVLVGHSMGAAEIIRYIARHGSSRVRKIALLAPVAPFVLRTPDNPVGAPLSFHARVWERFATDFPGWVYENQAAFFTSQTSKALQEAFTRQLLEVPLPVALAAQKALVTTDLRPDLSAIDRPLLILHGDKDVSAPLEMTGRLLAEAVEGSELKIYVGAPHGLWITHLADVNRDLHAFAR